MLLDKIIAHRGFSSQYPENTMLAFEKAVDLGCDCIETDVTILHDDTLVLFHDYHTKDHSNFDGVIHDLDSGLLQTVDAGSWKDVKFAHEKIPRLVDLLLFAKKAKIKLNLELKGESGQNEKYWEAIVRNTVQTVYELTMHDSVVYSSFEFPMLKILKKYDPQAKFGALFWEDTSHWQEVAQDLQPNSVNLYDHTVTPELVREIKKNHEVYVYTVNDVTRAEELFEMGVDGIFTDKADLFLK